MASKVYLSHECDELLLGNGRVELALSAGNGHFRHIRCLDTGIEHKRPDDGVWPFGLTVGTRDEPRQMRAEIRSASAQEMVFRCERSGARSGRSFSQSGSRWLGN